MSRLIVTTEEDLRQLVASAFADAIRTAAIASDVTEGPTDELAIAPGRLYSASEANALLGFDRMTIYEIPEADLPRCKIGPSRGSLRFLGADLLAYAKGLPQIDTQAMIDEARQTLEDRLSRPGPVVGAVGKSNRRRIV